MTRPYRGRGKNTTKGRPASQPQDSIARKNGLKPPCHMKSPGPGGESDSGGTGLARAGKEKPSVNPMAGPN